MIIQEPRFFSQAEPASNFVTIGYEIAGLVMQLFDQTQTNHQETHAAQKRHYLSFVERSITLQKEQGNANMLLGIFSSAFPIGAAFAAPATASLLQTLGPQVHAIGSIWPTNLQAESTRADRNSSLHLQALQEINTNKQGDESAKQGATSLVQSLSDALTRASQ